MSLPDIGDAGIAEILVRAASIRKEFEAGSIGKAIGGSSLSKGNAGARFLMAMLGHDAGISTQDIITAISAQTSTWQALCAELIRYSETTPQVVDIFLAVLSRREPKHAIAKAAKVKQCVRALPAFNVMDYGNRLSFVTGDISEFRRGTAFFTSIDNPVEWFTEARLIKQEGAAATFEVDRTSPLFADKTIVMRPSIFFVIQ